MKDYFITMASVEDEKDIMEFIDQQWSRNHILAVNKELFEWQYRRGNQIQFVLAKSQNDKKIIAILGFIMYGDSLKEDIMLALWKAVKGKNPFLGVELLEYLIQRTEGKVSCNGINLKTTKDIYEFMGFQINCMKHYYRLADKQEYKIAKIHNKKISILEYHYNSKLIEIKTKEELEENFNWDYYNNIKYFPHKSKEFIIHRYLNHPIYDYKIMAIIEGTKTKSTSFFVMREIKIEGIHILRIVDWIGEFENILYLAEHVDKILKEYDAEYIDFLEGGIEDEIMKKAGFIENKKEDENILPNYFEPYECSNVPIWYATKYKSKFAIFKADGDQDRPNLYKE